MAARNLVEGEMRRFLRSSEPEVLCIRGRWGVGKTYLWNKVLSATLQDSSYKLARYAYVSLFGLNSLEALKFTVFENSEFVVKGEETPGRDVAKAGASLVRQAQQYTKLLKAIPVVGTLADGLTPLFFQSIRDEVICFDDLERRSSGLTVAEVLGLISFLREQRNCKVALLLNDAALSAKDRADFDSYFEKVVDGTLTFAPTAAEAAAIAIEGRGKSKKRLADNVTRLGISNIRVIRKIMRAVDHVRPALRAFDSAVLVQAEQSLALFGWSVYQPDEAPPTSFIENWNTYTRLLADEKAAAPEQERWAAILGLYGFSNCDEFDLCLLDGVRSGVFDLKKIKLLGAALDREAKTNAEKGSISAAWMPYRESFDDDGETFVDGLIRAVRMHAKTMGPARFDGIASLVRKLRNDAEADALVDLYLEHHAAEERSFYNVADNHAFEAVTDPGLVRKLTERFDAMAPSFDIEDVLKEYARVEILDEQRREFLSKQPVDEFARVFRTTKGKQLPDFVNACLSSDRIINASPEERLISSKAKEALEVIGKENPLNAERVRTLYRVVVS